MRKALITSILVIFSVVFSLKLSAQSQSLKVGMELPTQLSVGYEDRFHEGWGYWVQAGSMFTPFNKMTLGTYQFLGVTKKEKELIEPMYKFAMVFSGGGCYYFSKQTRKQYIGPVFQFTKFTNKAIPQSLLNNYFNVNIADTFPIATSPNDPVPHTITMKGTSVNLGLVVGTRIPFYKIDNAELHVEFQLLKNFSSNNVIHSEYWALGSNLKNRFNEEVRSIYEKHGFIPSVNFFYIYKFSFKKF